MNHRERILRSMSGKSCDRVPVALWRHFPVDDQSPGTLAEAIVDFQKRYDFDFVKITPASTFCLKDWGVEDKWIGNPEGTRQIEKVPIVSPEQWRMLRPVSPNKGHLGKQLECIRLIKTALPKDTPIVQTIFNPLAQAKNLVGKDALLTHMRLHPDELLNGLRAITFVNACVQENIDGIFFAVQHAQSGLLSPTEFDTFVAPFDLEILNHVHSLWFNIAHIHGTDIYFDKVTKYPVQVLNWHDQQTAPNLKFGKSLFPGIVCGGLKQWETLVNGNPELAKKEAAIAIGLTEGLRFILGTGCVLPITSPNSNILAVRNSVEKIVHNE
jgi:uroporphyrinogen decarboxylase